MRLAPLALCVLLLAAESGNAMAATDDVPPLPDRNPMRVKAPLVAVKPPLPGEVPTVPWTDAEVAAAKAKCTEALASIKLDYEPLAPIKEGLCGAPAPILVKSFGSDPKVTIDPPATVSCPLAKEISEWIEEIVQPKAKELLNARVVKLHNATSYACRNRYGAAQGPLSEHALANALDVSEFVFDTGKSITVLLEWPRIAAAPPLPVPSPARPQQETADKHAVSNTKETEPQTVEVTKAKAEAAPPPSPPPVATEPDSDPETDFVHYVHDEACKEAFGTVLGPEANEAHKNHFHFDMKARRKSAYCQ